MYLKFSYRVQPLLPHVWETVLPSSRCYPWLSHTHSNSTKHLQICAKDEGMCKMRSQKKAEALQTKEAQHHKSNHDKQSKAVALEVGDMVLVCVSAFKGCHKIQDRCENREYVVKNWPYPNVQVYVVCPRDGEGCSQILHRNYLLPISPNIGQDEKDSPMAGVENNTSTPVPPMDSEPADAGPSRMVTLSAAGTTPQGRPDQPAPLRHNTQKNPEPTPMKVPEFWFAGRYQSIQHLGCIGWSVYLSPCLVLAVHHFLGKCTVNALSLCHHMSAKHHSLWH